MFHKAEFIPCYRNVLTIQAGTTCNQTPFMRRQGISAHMGFWIVECGIKGSSVVRFKAEFFPHYEEGGVFNQQ